MTNNTAAHIVSEQDEALGIDPAAFDAAAMDAIFEGFPLLEEDDDFDPFGEPLAHEDKVFSADPTGGAPSPW